jgi:hypothetical protein
MRCAALAFQNGGRRSVVTICDMSLAGIKIEGASFADGEEFRLVIPRRGDINARVRWAARGTAGARFDERLALDDLVPARERYALQKLRSYNFGSSRVFGRGGMAG